MSKQRVFAIDFDGTLADTGAVKSKYLREKFGLHVEPHNCNRSKYLSHIGQAAYEARILDVIKRFACPKFTATLAVHGQAVLAGEISR